MAPTQIQRDNDRVIIIISKTVSYQIIPTVIRLRSDPEKLWVTLKNKYESATLQRRLNLEKSLPDLKMKEESYVQDYYFALHRTWPS